MQFIWEAIWSDHHAKIEVSFTYRQLLPLFVAGRQDFVLFVAIAERLSLPLMQNFTFLLT